MLNIKQAANADFLRSSKDHNKKLAEFVSVLISWHLFTRAVLKALQFISANPLEILSSQSNCKKLDRRLDFKCIKEAIIRYVEHMHVVGGVSGVSWQYSCNYHYGFCSEG